MLIKDAEQRKADFQEKLRKIEENFFKKCGESGFAVKAELPTSLQLGKEIEVPRLEADYNFQGLSVEGVSQVLKDQIGDNTKMIEAGIRYLVANKLGTPNQIRALRGLPPLPYSCMDGQLGKHGLILCSDCDQKNIPWCTPSGPHYACELCGSKAVQDKPAEAKKAEPAPVEKPKVAEAPKAPETQKAVPISPKFEDLYSFPLNGPYRKFVDSALVGMWNYAGSTGAAASPPKAPEQSIEDRVAKVVNDPKTSVNDVRAVRNLPALTDCSWWDVQTSAKRCYLCESCRTKYPTHSAGIKKADLKCRFCDKL